ncbi:MULTISPECIES: HAD family hydrolase [unclassified Lacrimispora]|uniref:HAD family hydrolase n=1 Tax=unclassified Lacrimispora TaxID=2719232 RepID=UPI00376F882B
MAKAVFFDLFFTLIYPCYLIENEYDVIGILSSEWESYAENNILYDERAKGKIRNEREIIDRIVNIMPYKVTEEQKRKILLKREERMKRALLSIDNKVLEVLGRIREKGIKIGLISNADIIDIKYWNDSPMSTFFDSVIFSCDVGILKPETEIYQLVMKSLNVKPEESIFIGDGGSNELFGARRAGMKTIFSEYLDCKSNIQKEMIINYTDYHIESFDDILKYID